MSFRPTSRFISLLIVAVIVAAMPRSALAQAPAAAESESSVGDVAHTNRMVSLGAVGAAFVAANVWAYFAWYRGRNISEDFELRDEGWFELNTYAGGSDKLGHGTGGYVMVRAGSAVLEAGDWDPLSATLISTGVTLTWLFAIEVKDGYHEGFGWSNNDMIVNVVGSGLGALMHNCRWLDERFDWRLEYAPTGAFVQSLLKERGVDVAEDYSGQTFMLAYHLGSIEESQRSRYLSWVRYMDVVGGFHGQNYLPHPTDPTELPRQEIFVGLSLNMQQVLHEIFYEEGDTKTRRGPAVANFMAEVYGLPYTTLRLGTYERQKQTPLDLADE